MSPFHVSARITVLGFLKGKKKQSEPQQQPVEQKTGFFSRLRSGLQRTRQQLTGGLATLFLGKKVIDAALLEEIETQLLLADVGMEVTEQIIDAITQQVSRKALNDPQQLLASLKEELTNILTPVAQPLIIDTSKKPFIILMVGINGAGKTTTIGKLAKQYQQQGKQVMLAAGDTFRAAAIEQLQVWGERNNVPVIAQQSGSDSASVIYDAVQAAQARKIDVLIADTAGRLHTQTNLMEELKKVRRVITKLDETAPHEVMLVLDAGTGQNAQQQAQKFCEAVNVSGITLTKLDGTAKGGMIFAIAKSLATPIRFIGVGEKIDDLQPFDSAAFIDALFAQETAAQKENI